MNRLQLALFALLVHSGTATSDQQQQPRNGGLRKQVASADTNVQNDSMNAPVNRRDLSSTPQCNKSTEMDVPLVPAPLKYTTLNHNMKNVGAMKNMAARPIASPNRAHLTFCLDRIILDLSYILDVGTLVTDIDIECPGIEAPVHFMEPNFVMAVEAPESDSNRRHTFANGTYPGEVLVRNEDVLKILADGESCEFKVRAYNFDDGLLVGQLLGDAFVPANKPVNEEAP